MDQSIIDSINNDPISFMLDNNASTIISMIKYANEQYYNNQPVISDEIFDMLIDLIKDIDPTNQVLKQIGAKITTKEKIKLPYTMFSMNKIKPTDINILDRWRNEYIGPYICSDKLDGVSAMLYKHNNRLNLYTRGDGYEGSNISHIIKYLNLDMIKLEDNMAIRGELIMSKEKFKKYPKMANARNMVSGVVNSKKINPSVIADIDFVVYELVNPWIFRQDEQFNRLESYGFKVVNHIFDINIDFTNLTQIFADRKHNSIYDIDGIIVSNNILDNRTINSNPSYAFAFKDMSLSDSADVKVIEVEWNISKDGYIKPKLKLIPTNLSGVTISNVSAYNAKYIVDNVLGPGAIIRLIRSGDVIPKIISVIKNADSNKPQLPDIEYEWTNSNVDIVVVDRDTIDQKIKQLTFFIKKLNIENIDEANVEKLINANIDTIEKIITISKDQLQSIEGFKEKMINKIYTNINTRITKLTMIDLMIASNTFGHGIGEKKLKKITMIYPDIIKLYMDNDNQTIINKIILIEGFDVKTAEYFVNGLDNFIILFNNLSPNIRKQLRQSQLIEKIIDIDIDIKFNNKIFVFSGFRNKEWEQIIESKGGKIGSTISSKTNMLITSELDNTSSKVLKAKSLNIKIMTKNEFEDEYIN